MGLCYSSPWKLIHLVMLFKKLILQWTLLSAMTSKKQKCIFREKFSIFLFLKRSCWWIYIKYSLVLAVHHRGHSHRPGENQNTLICRSSSSICFKLTAILRSLCQRQLSASAASQDEFTHYHVRHCFSFRWNEYSNLISLFFNSKFS